MPTSMLMVATVAPTIRAFLLPYARHLRSQGWRVDACATGATGDVAIREAFDETLELGLSRSLKQISGLLDGAERLRRLVGSYDIVHVHTPIAGFLTRAAARSKRSSERPIVVYTAHGFHFHDGGSLASNFIYRLAEQIGGRWTDRLVVINADDFAAARRYHLVPPRRLTLMPGIGLDTDWYSQTRTWDSSSHDYREALGVPAGHPYLVMVGELSTRKRPLDVLAAFARMSAKDTWLVFVGSGPLRSEILERAKHLGVDQRIRLTGVLSDVRPVVSGAAALVLASEREGLPRAIMEALSLEVPVITTDIRGNRELVSSDVGRVIPLGDTQALAEAMDELVADVGLQQALGARGRADMIREYDIQRLLEMHDRMYSRLLAQR